MPVAHNLKTVSAAAEKAGDDHGVSLRQPGYRRSALSAAVESNNIDTKRDCRAASGDEMFDPERHPVTVLTLTIKDEKEISFSFASSKDLENALFFSSMIFGCDLFCCTKGPWM